jgi:Holliday junction resolvase
MTLLEKDIEGKVCKLAKAKGWVVIKIARSFPNGFPDRFFAKDGKVILIEFKRDGKEPTEQQAKRIRELRDAGVTVHVIDNIEGGCAIFK